MAEVRVRYTGKQPIIVNGVTWFQDEIHTVNEKMAQALVAMRAAQNDVLVLALPEMVEPHPSPLQTGEGAMTGKGTTDEMPEVWEEKPVVEEKPKRRRK